MTYIATIYTFTPNPFSSVGGGWRGSLYIDSDPAALWLNCDFSTIMVIVNFEMKTQFWRNNTIPYTVNFIIIVFGCLQIRYQVLLTVNTIAVRFVRTIKPLSEYNLLFMNIFINLISYLNIIKLIKFYYLIITN